MRKTKQVFYEQKKPDKSYGVGTSRIQEWINKGDIA
jgi:hypothetical protein